MNVCRWILFIANVRIQSIKWSKLALSMNVLLKCSKSLKSKHKEKTFFDLDFFLFLVFFLSCFSFEFFVLFFSLFLFFWCVFVCVFFHYILNAIDKQTKTFGNKFFIFGGVNQRTICIWDIWLDLTQQWLERKKDYVQDNNRLSASDALLQARRSMPSSSTSASSSTRVTITRLGTGGGVAGLSALRKHSRSGTKPRRLLPILVKLAEDCTPIENSDSDSSTYDSFNEMETGSYIFWTNQINKAIWTD